MKKITARGVYYLLLVSAVCWQQLSNTIIVRVCDLDAGTAEHDGNSTVEEKKNMQKGVDASERKKPSAQRDTSYLAQDGQNSTVMETQSYHTCTTEKGDVVTLPLLPQVILAGVQKAGTTAMYGLMEQHPGIQTTRRPEAKFFDTETYTSNKGCRREIRYAEKFVNVRRPELWLNRTVIYFEKTPDYFHTPAVPERIKTFSKQSDPRILIMLRNPVERALSQFKFYKVASSTLNLTIEDTFDEQLQLSLKRMKECGVLPQDATDIVMGGSESEKNSTESQGILPASSINILENMSLAEQRTRLSQYGDDMIIKGFYDMHLHNWLQEFPLDGGRIKVISYEDFRSNKSKVFNDVLHFIGLPPLPPPVAEEDRRKLPRFQKRLHSLRGNIAKDEENLFLKYFPEYAPQSDKGSSRSTGVISDETREYLQKLYDPHVDQLADMLGEEWRTKWW